VGIVVGVVVGVVVVVVVVVVVIGVAILAASVWLFFIQWHNLSSNTEHSAGLAPRGIGKEKPNDHLVYSPSGASELQHEPKNSPAELMGSDGSVEMVDTHRMAELNTSEMTIG
jgi:hypothetical protein